MWKYLLFAFLCLPLLNTQGQQHKTMMLLVQTADIQESPSFFSPSVSTINCSSLLTILEIKGAWAHVISEDMKSGWLHTSALIDRASVPYANLSGEGQLLAAKAERAVRMTQSRFDYNAVDKMEKHQASIVEINKFAQITTNNMTCTMPMPVKKISLCQEYYIGRAVAAMLLSHFSTYENRTANLYISTIGRLLAIHSDQPCLFSGYNFIIIDSNKIMSFSAPGGFIMVSRGLLRCCNSEDAVAAVLAHEIAHVQQQHAIGMIKRTRIVPQKNQSAEALGTTLAKAANDIFSAITNSGHAREKERDADRIAIQIIKQSGFNPRGFQQLLEQINKQSISLEKNDNKTLHSDPNVRLKEIEPLIRPFAPVSNSTRSKARFDKTLADI